MAKRKQDKLIAYSPIINQQDIPPIIEQTIQEIPRYEDSGVKYQGKYKVQKSLKEYELKGQQTRWYAMAVTALGNTTFTRLDKDTTKFYCTKMIITSRGKTGFGVSSYDIIYDTKNGVNASRHAFFPSQANETIVIDFTDSPRLFEGDFTINKYSAGAGDYTVFTLFGWEEQQ